MPGGWPLGRLLSNLFDNSRLSDGGVCNELDERVCMRRSRGGSFILAGTRQRMLCFGTTRASGRSSAHGSRHGAREMVCASLPVVAEPLFESRTPFTPGPSPLMLRATRGRVLPELSAGFNARIGSNASRAVSRNSPGERPPAPTFPCASRSRPPVQPTRAHLLSPASAACFHPPVWPSKLQAP